MPALQARAPTRDAAGAGREVTVIMMRKAAFVLACACAISLANSQSAFAQAGDAKKGIEAGNKAFSAAIAAGNAAGVAALYTDDAVAMPPNSEAVTGRPAIEKAFQGMIASGIKEVILTARKSKPTATRQPKSARTG